MSVDPNNITWGKKRVGDMSRAELVSFIGELNMTIAKIAREWPQEQAHINVAPAIRLVIQPAADQQLAQITPDNFDQVLADVLKDMDADDAAITSTQEDDAF